MGLPVIRAEGLGKRFRIGERRASYKTLRDSLTDAFAQVPRRLARRARTAQEKADRTIWAVRGVSFEVERGEVVGVIGRNGAGKSTLLKLLARITEPTEGRAVIRGRVGSLLEVGTGFHMELTGRENVYLNGAILGMKKAEIDRKFDEIVAFAEVERFIDTPVKYYSSGMHVRLAFAVAAHLEPEILLVDEVLAVGDAPFQRKCFAKIGEVARSGRTIILVSHNLAYVNRSCDRAILLQAGRVAADGECRTIVDTYLTEVSSPTGRGDLRFDTAHLLDCDAITVTLVELLTDDGRPLAAVQGGLPLRVRLHYSCKGTLHSVGFAVTFSTADGTEVLRLSTLPIAGLPITDLDGNGSVECRIDWLPLTGGRYSLGAGVSRPNVDFLTFNDNIGMFEVAPWDAYDSGYAVTRRCGVVAAPHRWSIHRDDRDRGGA